MPFHAQQDFREIASHNMNTIVHMLSHTDWDRHIHVMRDLVAMSEAEGLEVWMDNWGIGGPPGDKSHFLAYYPNSHQIYSNGDMDPVRACLNSPHFRQFSKEWIDAVHFTGCRTIFWDEPHLPLKAESGVVQWPQTSDNNGKIFYSCACPRCRKLFEEQYGHPMPETLNEEVNEFRVNTIIDYFTEVTSYAALKGLKNTVCVMLGAHHGISLENIQRLCSIPTLDAIGSDPYWLDIKDAVPYDYVYRGAKQNIDIANACGKDHNVWIQTYKTPRGREEEIVAATEAAYDAGARTILAWGFYGSQSNDYGAKNAPLVWKKTCDAMERVYNMERDETLRRNRELYRK